MARSRPKLLIVDDDPLALETLRWALSETYELVSFTDVAAAEGYLTSKAADLAILDLNLGPTNGLEVLGQWKKKFPNLEIIFCSGETRVDRAIETLRQGASDFVSKPINRADLLLIVGRVLEKNALKRNLERLGPLVQPHPVQYIGESAPWREIVDKTRLLRGQDHLNVLILGESGTGKEVVARLLHQQEDGEQRPFVVVNMPAIPASLVEAELFGVEKGAYTDAKQARAGKFELADEGDIFLDEIGDLPFDTQAKILRTLQEKQIERVGSNQARRVQFRVISATNRSLSQLIAEGRFREDLMYRLSDMVLWLAPLRERREDIPALAQHFLIKYTRPGQPVPELTERALQLLMDYSWPGNVRQLESAIKRALVMNREPKIDKVDIFDPAMLGTTRPGEPATYENRMAVYEQMVFEETLKKHSGDRLAACRELGISRATFYRKLGQLRNLGR